MSAKVTAAMIVAAVGVDGREELRYFNRGDVLPAGVSADEVTRLADAGLVEVGKGDSDAVEVPEGDPAKSWTVAQLEAYARNAGIDLSEAKNKDDKLAAISAAVSEAGTESASKTDGAEPAGGDASDEK